jgi:hypothetical protein
LGLSEKGFFLIGIELGHEVGAEKPFPLSLVAGFDLEFDWGKESL